MDARCFVYLRFLQEVLLERRMCDRHLFQGNVNLLNGRSRLLCWKLYFCNFSARCKPDSQLQHTLTGHLRQTLLVHGFGYDSYVIKLSKSFDVLLHSCRNRSALQTLAEIVHSVSQTCGLASLQARPHHWHCARRVPRP